MVVVAADVDVDVAGDDMQLSDIQTGDILAWKGFGVFGRTVSWVTHSPWTHVGVALRVKDSLLVVDAYIGKGVRCINIKHRLDEPMWCVSTSRFVSNKNTEFLLEKVGLPYSIWDGLRAVLRKSFNSPGYQCAEFANEYLIGAGLDTGITHATPALLMEIIENRFGKAELVEKPV